MPAFIDKIKSSFKRHSHFGEKHASQGEQQAKKEPQPQPEQQPQPAPQEPTFSIQPHPAVSPDNPFLFAEEKIY